MKKIILSTIAAFFGLALIASPSYAQAVFNSPGEMPTVTIVNSTRTVCNYGPITGCWQPSATAQAGDVVAVHIYYKNTSNTVAQGTTLGLTPQSSSATTAVSFSGGVASLSGPRAVGSASLSISSSQTVTYIPGSGKWYPSATSGTRPIDSNALFGTSGFNVGTVNPGEQGVLVAFFQVSNTTTTTYQCNDGYDNDGDGLIDYPSDPGCTSYTDNDEYNVTAQCVIDTFYASPTNVTSGGYTTLSWTTTGCDSATIDGVTYPVDGSGSFGPLYSSRNYELRATRGSSIATRQAYVSVNQNIEQCLINSFYASPTNIISGGYTTLYWNTTGCDYVTVDSITYPINGSGSFGPLYSSRNYELRATRGSSIATRQAYVSVNQVNPTIYQCNDGYDNDGDGKIDYPNDPGCTSYTDNDEYNAVINNTQPQAITTVASAVGKTSATLNGIAVPNSVYNTTSWFEWGTSSSLGFRTNSQTVNNNSSTYYNSPISGLASGVNYYYRAVVQNQNGTAYGDIVRFQTDKTTVVTNNPPTVITKVITQRDVVTAKSSASLLELRVENIYDRMCVGGEMDYTVTYRNISGQTLQNTVLRITHPKELTFINSSRGDYEVVDRTVTIALGDVRPGEQGTIQVRARVNTSAITGNLAVTTATVVYTNTTTRAQEDAIAYSLITVSNDCPNVLGASAFGISSFFPHTLVGWLLLILIILALIVITRQIYKKKEQQ